MVIWLMLVIQSLISFLSSRECYFPTIIWQVNRSIVGVSPLGIHPGGFPSFMSETVRFHHRRVIHLNNNLSKLCKSVQTHIWDPGVPIIRYEHGGKEIRLNRFNKSRVTLFSVRISDEGGQFPKTPTIFVHGGSFLFLNSLGDGGALPKVSTISSDGEAFFGLEDDETKFRSNLITKTCCIFLSMIQGTSLYHNYKIDSIETTGDSMFLYQSVLLGRRFVFGAFAHYRWNLWLSSDECPLTQWYGDVTWVFDPRINEGINLLNGTGIKYQIGYVSRTELGLSVILGILVTCARYGIGYSSIERDNGFLVPLKLSDDGDGFPLPWLEYFVSWIDCMRCGLYGSKIKVMTFFDDDDEDYFPWSGAFLLPKRVHRYSQLTCLWYNPKQVTNVKRRKMVKSDCDGDVFSFPWSENLISIRRKIMVTNRQRCVKRFEYIVLSFKRRELESFQATLQFFLLVRVMRKAFWSFIYKMIANYEYVKGGRNRFYLLACKASDWKAGSLPLLHRNCVQFPLFVSMVVFEWFIYYVKLFMI